MERIEEILFKLIAVGLGETSDYSLPNDVDWQSLWMMAAKQGVAPICLEGVQKVNGQGAIPHPIKLQWIASVLKQEQTYHSQWQAATALAELWHRAGMQTYVMKGFVLATMYPKPECRYSCDMDSFLKDAHGECSERGNRIVENEGIAVSRKYYKNSSFRFKGLTVENHRYLLPVKGSAKAKRFERWLRAQIETAEPVYIGASYLQTPSEMFNAVYILAHAQEHFFEEGIILKHVCDWAMLLRTYANKIDWQEWKRVCHDNGMLQFGYAMSRLAEKVCGIELPFECERNDEADKRLLDDMLNREANGNVHSSPWKIRRERVKEIFRKSWKYRMFSDTNALMFGTRRILGYLFDKNID